jgi:hypothetical protein
MRCYALLFFLPDSRPLFVHIAELAIKLDPGLDVVETVGIEETWFNNQLAAPVDKDPFVFHLYAGQTFEEAVNILVPGLHNQFSAFVDKTPAVIQSHFGQAFTKIIGIFKTGCDDLPAGMIDEGLHLVDLYPSE